MLQRLGAVCPGCFGEGETNNDENAADDSVRPAGTEAVR